MINAPEQVGAFGKANLESALKLANIALDTTERMVSLQLTAAREALAENANQAKALLSARDPQELLAIQQSLGQPSLQRMMGYSRSVYELATQVHAELTKMTGARIADMNSQLATTLATMGQSAAGSDAAVAVIKSAMAAANTAYDNLTKAAKQMTDMTEANVSAATEAVTGAAKPAVRKAK